MSLLRRFAQTVANALPSLPPARKADAEQRRREPVAPVLKSMRFQDSFEDYARYGLKAQQASDFGLPTSRRVKAGAEGLSGVFDAPSATPEAPAATAAALQRVFGDGFQPAQKAPVQLDARKFLKPASDFQAPAARALTQPDFVASFADL
jgi:hypothetical protein